jgi:hypothetical protein
MNFYNGQWLIRDFGRLWPSIRFEYFVCIFLLLGSTVPLSIDDHYGVNFQNVYEIKKEKMLLEKGYCSPH